jgi:transposase
MAWHRSNQTSKRLDEIPGVGPALATALVASVPNPNAYRSGRNFSANRPITWPCRRVLAVRLTAGMRIRKVFRDYWSAASS